MNTFDSIFLTISHVIVLQPDEISNNWKRYSISAGANLGAKCNLEKSHTWFPEKCLKSVGRYPQGESFSPQTTRNHEIF
jgi:hypothetical protein